MPDENIDIHVRARDTEQTKQKVDSVAKSTERLGNKTNEAGKKGADGLDKAEKKTSALGRMADRVKSQVIGMVGAWLGLQGVQKIVTWLIAKLERISELQKQIYQESLALAQIGQSLEFQTGTVGQQQQWAARALQLQKAGALASPAVAQQMMVSGDIAFNAQGGIRNPQVMAMLNQLAPFVGTAGFQGAEVAKLFEFAGTAGVAPTPDAYQKFFGQIQATYTQTKATDPGLFMTGLQGGVTGYLAQGGSLTEGLAAFAGARAVSQGEARAATLVEQMARVASGAYERPRQAMEAGLGVSWQDLTMDQRTQALLQHIGSIPEAQRTQTLAEQGFPVELTTQLGKMVSPEAVAAMAATREKVSQATAVTIGPQVRAFMESDLAKDRQVQADVAAKKLARGPEFAAWQRRITAAKSDVEDLISASKDRLYVPDRLEPYLVATEQMRAEMIELLPDLSEADRQRAETAIALMGGHIRGMKAGPFAAIPTSGADTVGQRHSKWLQDARAAAGGVTVNNTNIYDNSVRYERPAGVAAPRVGPDDI